MLAKSAKLTNYKEFRLDDTYEIRCWTYETRYSWGHYAEVREHGHNIVDEKYTYYNRTWESYTYQSIIHSLIGKAKLPKEFKDIADSIGNGNVRQELKVMGGIVAMAGLLQPEQSNDAKIKALELVTGGQVTRPEDWDELTEETKSFRLKKALEVLN